MVSGLVAISPCILRVLGRGILASFIIAVQLVIFREGLWAMVSPINRGSWPFERVPRVMSLSSLNERSLFVCVR